MSRQTPVAQLRALEEIKRLIPYVADHTWSTTVTSDEDDAVLNIFVGPGMIQVLASKMYLGEPIDRGEDFVSFKREGVTVSFIEGEDYV